MPALLIRQLHKELQGWPQGDCSEQHKLHVFPPSCVSPMSVTHKRRKASAGGVSESITAVASAHLVFQELYIWLESTWTHYHQHSCKGWMLCCRSIVRFVLQWSTSLCSCRSPKLSGGKGSPCIRSSFPFVIHNLLDGSSLWSSAFQICVVVGSDDYVIVPAAEG